MTPGPKKKQSQRLEGKSFGHKKGKNCPQTIRTTTTNLSSDNLDAKTEGSDEAEKVSEKCRKGIVESNWHRYDEPVTDDLADTTRDTDCEVLLSYSGGTGTQLQLQEEQDWSEHKMNSDFLVLDLINLTKMYKCLPFHKQLHIPEDVFSVEQIDRFKKCSDHHLSMFQSASKDNLKAVIPPEENYEFDMVEKANTFQVCEDTEESANLSNSIPVLPEKTESLIETLASCLIEKKDDEVPICSVKENNYATSEVAVKDDLDFLLALSTSDSNCNEHGSTKQPNVDEWLNSILDD